MSTLEAYFQGRRNLFEGLASYFVDYRADAAGPLAMLYQSGYLTIKGYDREYRTDRLDFPNAEVQKGFATLVAADYLKSAEMIDTWCLKVEK